jgi:hypothetical protein
MVIHPLIDDQVNGTLPQTLGDGSFEGFVAAIVVKDRLPGIAAIQEMVNRSSFIGPWRSRHVNHPEPLINKLHFTIY